MKRTRLYCNSCESDTWHQVPAHREVNREDTLFGYPQRLEAEILQCCGCDLFSFRTTTHPFEFQDKADMPEVVVLPERGYKQRKRKFFSTMPASVRTLYNETVTAHDNKLVLLSAVGLRALLEAIVIDKLAPSLYGNNLESKINALAHLFPADVIQTLHAFRVAGNAAVHDQNPPDHLDTHRALYVIEAALEYFYGVADSARTYTTLKTPPKAK
ncbi:MAG: DUF4145 domain-containing protein [Burkholderiaceae bacterium]